MIRPDYRVLKNIAHSAKGSTWDEHKYIKRIDGTYYYPDSYKGGRHLSEKNKETNSSNNDVLSELEKLTGMTRDSLLELRDLSIKNGYDSKEFKEMLDILSEGDQTQAKKITDLLKKDDEPSLNSNDVENLAKEVIRGNFGNGQERKDLLGDNYDVIQKRVNELMRGSAGSKKIPSNTSGYINIVENVVKKASGLVDMAINKKINRR